MFQSDEGCVIGEVNSNSNSNSNNDRNRNPWHSLKDWKTRVRDVLELQKLENDLAERRRKNEDNASKLEYEILRQWQEWKQLIDKRKRDLSTLLSEVTEKCNNQLNAAQRLIRTQRYTLELADVDQAQVLENEKVLSHLFNPSENYDFMRSVLQETILRFEPQNLPQLWDINTCTENISKEEKEPMAKESKLELSDQEQEKGDKLLKNSNLEIPKTSVQPQPLQSPSSPQSPQSPQSVRSPQSARSSQSAQSLQAKLKEEAVPVPALTSNGEESPKQSPAKHPGIPKEEIEGGDHVNYMKDSELRNLLSKVKEELWYPLSESTWLKNIFASDSTNKTLCDYITKDGTLDLTNGKYLQLNIEQKEQLKYGLTLQQIIVDPIYRKRFRRLAPMLEKLGKVSLSKNTSEFGMKDIEWIGSIVSSRYCLIESVLLEASTNLTIDHMKKIGEICQYGNNNHNSKPTPSTMTKFACSSFPHINIICRINNPKTFTIQKFYIARDHDLDRLAGF